MKTFEITKVDFYPVNDYIKAVYDDAHHLLVNVNELSLRKIPAVVPLWDGEFIKAGYYSGNIWIFSGVIELVVRNQETSIPVVIDSSVYEIAEVKGYISRNHIEHVSQQYLVSEVLDDLWLNSIKNTEAFKDFLYYEVKDKLKTK